MGGPKRVEEKAKRIDVQEPIVFEKRPKQGGGVEVVEKPDLKADAAKLRKTVKGGEKAGGLDEPGLPEPNSISVGGKNYEVLILRNQTLFPNALKAGWQYAGAVEKQMIFSRSKNEREEINQAIKAGSLELE